MKTKNRTILIALGVAAAVAAGGVAVAQSMQPPMGQMGPGMQGMHGNMQANMHGAGMQHGGMHGDMHAQMQGMKGGMQGMHGQGMQGMHGQGMHGQGMQGGMQHGGDHGQSGATGDQSASSLAFAAVNDKMHRDMAISFTGNADADFVRGMIPHHQGAVDMAKIVIVFGKDPEIRKLAEEIVKAQETEIAFMQAWLKKQGPVSRN